MSQVKKNCSPSYDNNETIYKNVLSITFLNMLITSNFVLKKMPNSLIKHLYIYIFH